MRTTVTLDDDVVAALHEMRRAEGLPTSAALNALVRRALASRAELATAFTQRTSDLGASRMSLDNIAEVLALADGEDHR